MKNARTPAAAINTAGTRTPKAAAICSGGVPTRPNGSKRRASSMLSVMKSQAIKVPAKNRPA